MADLHLAGSCLCGSVAYEIDGELLYFNHCHCERCRKATGTGHASNIILHPASIRWIAGEDLLGHYRLPEAKRFGTVWCSRCGSQMPRHNAEREVAVVPAGTLDIDPGISPERRIFRESAAPWSCSADDLPSFDRYPTSD